MSKCSRSVAKGVVSYLKKNAIYIINQKVCYYSATKYYKIYYNVFLNV